jgi:hypothetical protein
MIPRRATLACHTGARDRDLGIASMDFVSIALIIVGIWICIVIFVLAISKASARADSEGERMWAARSNAAADGQSRAELGATLAHTQRSIDPAEPARDADRLGLDMPKHWRPSLKRVIGARHPHS